MERNRIPLATAGLFVAWLTHDLGERALEKAGVPNRRSLLAAIALLAGFLAAGHVTAYVLTANQP